MSRRWDQYPPNLSIKPLCPTTDQPVNIPWFWTSFKQWFQHSALRYTLKRRSSTRPRLEPNPRERSLTLFHFFTHSGPSRWPQHQFPFNFHRVTVIALDITAPSWLWEAPGSISPPLSTSWTAFCCRCSWAASPQRRARPSSSTGNSLYETSAVLKLSLWNLCFIVNVMKALNGMQWFDHVCIEGVETHA